MLITRQGLKKAHERLLELQTRVIELNKEISELYTGAGDQWHDNPEWLRATQEKEAWQRKATNLEGEIHLAAEFIEDMNLDYSVVNPGAEVTIQYLNAPTTLTFVILGPLESDSDNNIISAEAPLAIEMMGKKVGDRCHINSRPFDIVSIARWAGLDVKIDEE